jgi:hypothetical protein
MMKKYMAYLLISIPLMAGAMRPDAHAPIGVMADHTHRSGTGMIAYRIMNMPMATLMNGSHTVSISDVHKDYMMSPKRMTMTMHMLGGMLGYSDHMTLTAMVGYRNNHMTMVNKMNQSSTMRSEGLGDIKLGAIIKLNDNKTAPIVGHVGISLPTGAINKTNTNGEHLPYGMQLGSGTYDLILGSTGKIYIKNWSFGAQLNGTLRLGKNRFNYRWGNSLMATAWAQKTWGGDWAASIRSTLQHQDTIHGSDDTLTSMQINMSPTYDSQQGGTQVTLGIGTTYAPATWKHTRLLAEISTPIYKRTHSVALVQDTTFVMGIQKAL